MAFKSVILTILTVTFSLGVTSGTVSKDGTKLPFVERMFSTDANADPRCLRGFRHKNSKRICCSPECTVCGGRGCRDGGGRSSCCVNAINRSGRSCDTVGAPCVPSITFPRPSTPDPSCRTGILREDICCPEGCITCGGADCASRTPAGALRLSCCLGRWKRRSRTCDKAGAPCRVTRDNSRWVTITARLSGRPTPRHEACMAWYNGKGYLVGGRRQPPLEIFDPAAGTWTRGASIGIIIHHMQCVGWGGKIWIVSAWTGSFPRETNVEDVYVYDIASDSWSTRPGLPTRRLRGGAASILFDDKIWVIGGNIGGHGAHATTLGWMDYFDLRSETWTSDLPDLPEGRDHVQGGVVNGEMLCISGGRDGGVGNFFTATITSTYCYTPRNGGWRNMNADLPGEGRGGTMAVTTCEGELMIAGGERLAGAASRQVDLFDGVRWRTSASMNRGRHGGGLVVSDCNTCGKIFVVSGSANRGGGPELDSTEMYLVNGEDVNCESF